MENVRARKRLGLIHTEDEAIKTASKPTFIGYHAFTENLILTEHTNFEVCLNKPIFCGQAVLDLSKLIMYELRYLQLPRYEQEFGGRISVFGGDTDSLMCKISGIIFWNNFTRQWFVMASWIQVITRQIIRFFPINTRPSSAALKMRARATC